MMRITRISSTEDFAALRDEWNTLLSVSKADTVFLTWEWAFSWWEAFHNADTNLFVLVVTDHDKTIGIAPLVLTRRRFGGLFALRQIKFLGADIACGDYLDFIIDSRSQEREVLRAILEYLQDHHAEWDHLCLTEVPEGSVNVPWIADMAKDLRYRFAQGILHVCPSAAMPETWEALEMSLNKDFRRNLKYEKRQLLEKRGGAFRLCDEQNLEAELDAFWTLHEMRWNSKGQAGSFTDPSKREFYRKMATRCSEKKWLRLCFLTVDNARIATLLGFQYGNRFYGLQTGFDPAWSKFSVGHVLLACVVEHALAEGSREYDFLRGTEPYKYDWKARDKNTLALRITNRNVRARLLEAMIRLKRLALK
jgi:CelD/BcsL family acetyltransferase involved in cellulose biosynthesis